MKFIADSMLGRLAKWLRLLGHDTLYFPHIVDSLLLRIAREESRTLLTRDSRLVKVRDITPFLFLVDNDPFAQLKKVITTYRLSPFEQSGQFRRGWVFPPMHSRCSLCNTVLIDTQKEDTKEYVPKYVYNTASNFKKCPACVKFYWEGTHRARFMSKLREILHS